MAIHRRALDCLAVVAMTIAVLLATPAAAQSFPQLTGRVVDQANLLSPEQEVDLSSKSEALEQQTGAQFVVATVNSLEGLTVEDYGYRLGRHWGIGRAEEDDGIILLVAPNEKKVRIETGYGAEGVLPDILAGRIIRNEILPRFRQGDMAGGIMAGASAIIGQIGLPPEQAQRNIAEAQRREAARGQESPSLLPVLFIMIIFFAIVGSLARRVDGRRYRRGRRGRRGRGFDAGDAAIILWGLSSMAGSRRGGWGGGGGFGGFGGGGFGGFSGGGGGFGGGGASGGW